MLPAAEILLVQDSFRTLTRTSTQVAALFYSRLFELDSAQRENFSANPHERGSTLMVSMARALSSLETASFVAGTTRSVGPSTTTAHTALFWTLQKCLGADFTPAVRTAWARSWAVLGDAITDAPRAAHDHPRHP
ncbi:MAG: hypothetical protein ABIQ12_07870 [Opitutaceae bacterium]